LTSNITFKFAGDVTPLRRATKQATGELEKFGGKMKSSFSPANLLGPVAAAASFTAIADAVSKATKAYFEDQKSLGTLNGLIDNNTNATSQQKMELDGVIQKMSAMSAVADDDLRNAMSKLVVATKDVSKSQELLQLSLDVSAGTGKDLGAVSAALSKAYNGNYTALSKRPKKVFLWRCRYRWR
jgi:ABC-type transporter Mla subunit MlaD